ncbi:MAG: ATP-binding cassette domain-containing protein, partial [Rhodobacteraceae bacterium]|nr:ATP-binding cassette domain-containing protein [Paracoccaceae bacterium]
MRNLRDAPKVTGGYGNTKVPHGVSASIDQGHILGVFGRNGVGKTTLAKLLNGGLRASSGTIRLSGQDITGLPANARRGAGI